MVAQSMAAQTSIAIVVTTLMASNVFVSAVPKCKWTDQSKTCEFNMAAFPSSSTGALGSFIANQKVADTCKALAVSSTCTANTDCVWLAFHGVCKYKDEWKQSEIAMGDLTGCTGAYALGFSKDCGYYETEAACNSGPCSWSATPNYAAASVTTVYHYDGQLSRCVGKPSQNPGTCSSSSYARFCGSTVNKSLESNHTYNPVFLPYFFSSCFAAVAGDDFTQLKLCLTEKGACSNMITDANVVHFKKKLNGTFNDTADYTAFQTMLKACVTERMCASYADVTVPLTMTPQCDSLTEAVCGTTTGCGWVTAHGGSAAKCKAVKSIRDENEMTDPGSSTCIYSKHRKAEGLFGLTDAQVMAKYNSMESKKATCNAFNVNNAASSGCTATNKCAVDSHTAYSCSNTGVATVGTTHTRCDYKAELEAGYAAMDKKKMGLMFSDSVANKVQPILKSCAALTSKSNCEGATLTTAEVADIAAAAMDGGTADTAFQMFPHSVLVLLITAIAAMA